MIFVSATQFHTHFAWCPISLLNVKVPVVIVKTSRRFVGSSISGSIVYTTQTAARSQESGRQNNSSNLGHCLRGGMHHHHHTTGELLWVLIYTRTWTIWYLYLYQIWCKRHKLRGEQYLFPLVSPYQPKSRAMLIAVLGNSRQHL